MSEDTEPQEQCGQCGAVVEGFHACECVVPDICTGCDQEIDLTTCGCGTSKDCHGSAWDDGHPFIPLGCNCYRAKPYVPEPKKGAG